MCPACMASAAWVVGGVVSTGGASALAAKILGKSKFVANRKTSSHESMKRSEEYVGNHKRDDRNSGK